MKRLMMCGLMVLVSACVKAPEPFTPPPLTFSNAAPISVNVAEIKVIDEYRAPVQPPNIEHAFPVPPAAAVKQWVQARMQAVGTQGTLEITIHDASVKETALPKTKGVKGLLTNDQEARYDATLNIGIRLYDGVDPMSVASGDVTVSRSKTIDERANVEDHERLYDAMTREMLAAFDTEMVTRLRQFFAAYVM